MGKNNKLINSLAEIARRNRQTNVEKAAYEQTPQIYAALAIALHRKYGFGYVRINRVFLESQHIWENEGDDVIKLCKEETGIELRGNNEKT